MHFLLFVASPERRLPFCPPQAKNGVVIATEKKLPSVLVDESTVQKVKLARIA